MPIVVSRAGTCPVNACSFVFVPVHAGSFMHGQFCVGSPIRPSPQVASGWPLLSRSSARLDSAAYSAFKTALLLVNTTPAVAVTALRLLLLDGKLVGL